MYLVINNSFTSFAFRLLKILILIPTNSADALQFSNVAPSRNVSNASGMLIYKYLRTLRKFSVRGKSCTLLNLLLMQF